MARRRHLLRALNILTDEAPKAVPQVFVAEAEAMHEDSRSWVQGENIQGLGLGPKISGGQELDEMVLKVYVDRKLPKAKCQNLVPQRLQVPGVESEVLTDVEEIGVVELEMDTTRSRPAMPGSGVGHPLVTVGTFGCLVRKRGTQEPLFILSNSHILANSGVAQVGDEILQPAFRDDGEAPDDVIGTLSEWIDFEFTDTGYPNLVDAAIAEVERANVTSIFRQLNLVPGGTSDTVRKGMQVRKVGRTTDLTYGEIKDIYYRVPLSYRRANGMFGRAGFRDQVLCTRYTDGGDSGSAVLNSNDQLVGLHFAGSASASIFTPIRFVFDALDLELVTQSF